jgi:hypothetical protein
MITVTEKSFKKYVYDTGNFIRTNGTESMRQEFVPGTVAFSGNFYRIAMQNINR